MARRPFRLRTLVFTTLAAALAIFLARSWWLPWMGALLVHDDGPARAEMVVAQAGDYTGGRLLRGAELARQGYAPAVLVSGPEGLFEWCKTLAATLGD